MENIEKMRKKSLNKEEKKKTVHTCDLCNNTFSSQQGLKVHINKIQMLCELCDSFLLNSNELEKHQIDTHSEIKSPDSKKMNMKERKKC